MKISYLAQILPSVPSAGKRLKQRIDYIREYAKEMAAITGSDDNILSITIDESTVIDVHLDLLESNSEAFLTAVSKAIESHKSDDEEVSIDYLDSFVNGSVVLRKANPLDALTTLAPRLEMSSSDFPIKGAANTVTAVVGLNRSGKSKFTNDVVQPHVSIRHGEPLEEYDLAPNVIRAATFPAVIFGILVFGGCDLLTSADSFRTEVYRMKGAASAQGVKPSILLFLSDLSNLMSYLQQSTVILVNPMMAEDKVQVFVDQIDSSVGGYIWLSQAQVKEAYIRHNSDRVDIKAGLSSMFDSVLKRDESADERIARIVKGVQPRANLSITDKWTVSSTHYPGQDHPGNPNSLAQDEMNLPGAPTTMNSERVAQAGQNVDQIVDPSLDESNEARNVVAPVTLRHDLI